MGWYGHGMSGWGFALMALITVALWGALVIAAVALVRSMAGGERRPDTGPQRPTPQEILADRLARGEIDEEDYRRRLQALSAG